MQWWEVCRITQPNLKARIPDACLGQSATATVAEIVVFVTRRNLSRQRAKAVFDSEFGNVRRNSPRSGSRNA